MFQGRAGNVTRTVFGFTTATALFACAPANNEYSSAEQSSAKIVAKAGALTAAEWTAQMANQRYVHSLVKPRQPVHLNFADPRQHAFAMGRLKLAGKDAKNSPYLFELIEQRRQKHLLAGLKVGKLADEERVASESARAKKHLITQATATDAIGAAASTYPDGAWYTWLDVAYSTASGFPISDYAYSEEFERPEGNVGADIAVSTVANPALSNERKWSVTTYKFEDSPSGFTDSYQYDEFGSDSPVQIAEAIDLSRITIEAPLDTKPAPAGDGVINLCIHRPWTTDCDTVLDGPNGYWDVQIPLKGWVVINSGHKFDRDEITAIKDSLERGIDHPMAGEMTLVLSQHGGACTPVNNEVTLQGRMRAFWRTVVLAPGDRHLSWNLTGSEVGVFDRSCAIHDKAKLTVRIPYTLLEPPNYTTTVTDSMAMSTDARELPPDPNGNENGEIKPLIITNSCLAEGTQVSLGGGKQVAIEKLKIGQEIYSPFDRSDEQLTITDTAKGVEPMPMVRIKDDSGRTLLLTETHPIATPDRGMVQARWLRAGDAVQTATGTAKLAEITRETYRGFVYNLKLGTDAEKQNLGADQTVIYANGFVVGDGQIQSKYDELALKQETASTAADIPAQWRRDYQLSKQRAKGVNQQ